MKPLLIFIAAICLCGCAEVSEPMDVEIVAVVFDEESGVQDYYTIVEFPDGDRRRISGKFGEVGDRFKVRRASTHPSVRYLETTSD